MQFFVLEVFPDHLIGHFIMMSAHLALLFLSAFPPIVSAQKTDCEIMNELVPDMIPATGCCSLITSSIQISCDSNLRVTSLYAINVLNHNSRIATPRGSSVPSFPNGIPESIGNLTELQSVRIESIWPALKMNIWAPLPSSIGKLKKLQTLIIDWSSLVGSIPEEIGECTSLKTIDIHRNVCASYALNKIATYWRYTLVHLESQVTSDFDAA